MKVHPVHPSVPQVAQLKSKIFSSSNEDQDGEASQSGKTTSGPATLQVDPSRLPEKAQQSVAHSVRALIAAQAESSAIEETKNFGQIVSKLARGEQSSEIRQLEESEENEEI